MNTRRLIPLLFLLAACSPEGDEIEDIDLGDLPAADKADLAGFEIPISLGGGQATPLFHITADDRFTVRVIQTTSSVQTELRVFAPSGGTLSSVGKEPTITVVPSTAGTQSYSIQITNLSSFSLNGTLVISSGGGGGGGGTEKTKLTLTGYATGDEAGSSESAMQKWELACEDWRQTQYALSGADHIESFNCNAAVQVGTSAWRYESEPQIVVVASVPSGTQPLVSPSSIEGGPAGSSNAALTKWRDACTAHFFAQQKLFGSRLLGARCPRPTQIGTSQWNYSAIAEIYLQPPTGTTLALPGFVSSKSTGSRESALASWKLECDEWASTQFARSGGDKVASYGCGEAIQVGTSQWRFESVTQVVLATGLPAGQLPTSVTQTVEGSPQGSQDSALTSWKTACNAKLDQQASLAGSRFVGGACAKPTQIGTSQWKYRGQLEVRLTPL